MYKISKNIRKAVLAKTQEFKYNGWLFNLINLIYNLHLFKFARDNKFIS